MPKIDKPRGEWTIHDIARELGVSAKTVSRVLNHKDGVGAELRERIQRLMAEVGYQPHLGARSLRTRISTCIGVTMPVGPESAPLSQHFVLWIIEQIYAAFGRLGEYVCLDLNPRAGVDAGDYSRGIWQHLFKACVIAGPLPVDDRILRRIHDSGTRYVVFSRLDSVPEANCAVVDYERAAYESTRFLIERGHRRIAMLRSFEGLNPGLERLRGYQRALKEAGIPFDERLIRSTGLSAESVIAGTHFLLAQEEVTALIDSSGMEDGESLREGAARAGKRLGREGIELVAWSYQKDMAVCTEASAHVWLPMRESAREGIMMLADRIYGRAEGPIRVVYPPVLQDYPIGQLLPTPKRFFYQE